MAGVFEGAEVRIYGRDLLLLPKVSDSWAVRDKKTGETRRLSGLKAALFDLPVHGNAADCVRTTWANGDV